MSTSQASIARLEGGNANPLIENLDALRQSHRDAFED